MSSAVKNNNFHYGAKVHIGVDVDSVIVHTVEVTTAKVHNNNKIDDLLLGNEKSYIWR